VVVGHAVPVTQGGVILLNGTSSSGKTTLAVRLQADFAAAGGCWIVVALDDYLGKLPGAWHRIGDHVGAYAEDGFTFDLSAGGVRIGPVGRRLLEAYRSAVRSVAVAGINVIVDEVVLADDGPGAWERALRGLDTMWVRVEADPTITDERESARGDRLVGLARAQRATVHDGIRYDLTIDSGTTDPGRAAEAVCRAWSTRSRADI
jgi:chloramphenicol 3-O phosphotransferase